MTEYKPGTVAIIRQFNAETGRRAVRVGNVGWHLRPCSDAEDEAGLDFVLDALIADVRPLVVLDLDAANPTGIPEVKLQNLLSCLRDGTDVCRAVADQIEAQTKPPRIPEPGLWGVVRADWSNKDNGELHPPISRGEFVRTLRGWSFTGDGYAVTWSELIDPTLIREGVSE